MMMDALQYIKWLLNRLKKAMVEDKGTARKGRSEEEEVEEKEGNKGGKRWSCRRGGCSGGGRGVDKRRWTVRLSTKEGLVVLLAIRLLLLLGTTISIHHRLPLYIAHVLTLTMVVVMMVVTTMMMRLMTST